MPNVDFTLSGEYVELNQLLKLVGLCDSGGAGKMLVAEGLVKVDRKLETRKTAKIRAGQVVVFGDVRITVKA
jgi:ribosome-associated protein